MLALVLVVLVLVLVLVLFMLRVSAQETSELFPSEAPPEWLANFVGRRATAIVLI